MVFLASLLIGGALSLPQRQQDPQPERRDLLTLHLAGPRTLLVDPKDAVLRGALELLGPRVAELPDQLGVDARDGAPLFALLGRACTRPLDLRMGVAPEAPVPFYAQLQLREGSPDAARAAGDELLRALEAMDVPMGATDARGLRPLDTGGPPTWVGVRDEELLVALGAVLSEPAPEVRAHLPEGTPVALSLGLDLAGAFEMVEAFGMGGPELAPLLSFYEQLGLTRGRLAFALGVNGERAVMSQVLEGAVPQMRAGGMLPEEPISLHSLRAVPADASWAVVGVNNLPGLVGLLRRLGAQVAQAGGLPSGGEDPIEALAEATGVHLERDVLAHLGSSLGAYASDTTGGGGLTSAVLYAEVRDGEALSRTTTRIESLLNSLAAEEAEGYVQIRVRMLGGLRCSTLTFPGLPVPLEPTWTQAGGFFVMGMTPQAVLAAAGQVQQPETSLLDTAAFQEQLPGGPDGLYGLSWVDSRRMLRDGYGWAALACSALANGVRSGSDLSREPGTILPPYHELARGVKACVTATRVVGDDLVETTRMDRSLLVNATAMAGLLDSMPLLMALPGLVAFTVPRAAMATQNVQEQVALAEASKARADILALHYACVEYALLNDGRFPDTLDVLVLPDANGVRFLEREALPTDPWGHLYGYAPPPEGADAPRIYTLGRDGRPGGFGPDADLDNHGVLEGMRQDR